jgi:O-antigen ligase
MAPNMPILRYLVAPFFVLSSIGSLDVIDRLLYGEWPGKTGDKLTETLHFLFISACILLYWFGAQARRNRVSQRFPLAAVALLLVSAFWSVNPYATVKHAGEYFFLVLGTIGIVQIFDDDAVMKLLTLTVALSVLASVILYPLVPSAIWLEDNLRGVFSGKNMFGQAMVTGVLAGLHCLRARCRPRSLYHILTAFFTIIALVSRSTTSVLVIINFFVLNILIVLYARRGSVRIMSIFVGIGVMAILMIVATDPESFLGIFSKNTTLTGRTDLWPYVVDDIAKKPIFGWGFGAFWLPSNPVAAEISAILGWWVVEAHNGMLDLLLQIGAVGTAYFIFLLGRNVIIAIKCICGQAKDIGVTALLVYVGIVIIGISEAVLVAPENIFTSLFFMLGLMCERRVRASKRPVHWHSAPGFDNVSPRVDYRRVP